MSDLPPTSDVSRSNRHFAFGPFPDSCTAAICELHDLIAALWSDSSLALSRRSRKLAFVFDCHPMASVSGMTENTTSSGRGGLNAMLMPLINGFMAARVVHVAAELGIADLLAAGARSTETLASETGANILALHQLLRALASSRCNRRA